MKFKLRNKVLLLLLIATSVFSIFATKATQQTIYVIGDSTASSYGSDRYPRTGWAQVLQPFLNSETITVSNHAASGRSSKSFYDEGRWTTVVNSLKAGDYVIIQFAHNDEKTDAERHTDPATTFKDYMNIYIDGAIAKGAYPILVSSIPRNNWSGVYIKQAHEPYTNSMKELAASKNIPFIDMEASTMNYLNSKGKAYATDSVFNNLKAGEWKNYLDGNSDGTHLQEKGAFEFCELFIKDLTDLENFSQIDILKNAVQDAVRISTKSKFNLKGSISGGGVYATGTMVTLKATPVSNWAFDRWTLKNNDATYSNNATIEVTADENLDFIANFKSLTSVQNLKNDLKVLVNQKLNEINISGLTENFQVKLIDINGKIHFSDSNKAIINTQNLTHGIYLLKIQTANFNHQEKITLNGK